MYYLNIIDEYIQFNKILHQEVVGYYCQISFLSLVSRYHCGMYRSKIKKNAINRG